MPRRWRKCRNRSKSSSGRSRSITVVTCASASVDQAPAWSQLPLCDSAMTTPRPSASAARAPSPFSSRQVVRMRSWRPVGQPERVAPVPHVRVHALAGQRLEPVRRRVGHHARQVGLELAHAAALPQPRDLRDQREQQVGGAFGERPDDPPPQGVGPERELLTHGHPPRCRCRLGGRVWSGGSGRGGSGGGGTGRRGRQGEGLPAHVEHPLDDGHEARDGQQGEDDEEHDRRQAEADEAGGEQHGDEPVGALGHAHGRGHAEALGPGARVRDELPEHQAGQRQADEGGGPPLPGMDREVDDEAAEDRRVAEPVERGVEEGPPRRGSPQQPGHDPVDAVGEDEQRDDDRAPEERPAGVERQRTDDDPERADERDRVGADPEREQRAGSRRQEPGDQCSGEPVEHDVRGVGRGPARRGGRGPASRIAGRPAGGRGPVGPIGWAGRNSTDVADPLQTLARDRGMGGS